MRWLLLLLVLPVASGQLFVYDDPAGDQAPFPASVDYTRLEIHPKELHLTFSEENDDARRFQVTAIGATTITVECHLGEVLLASPIQYCEWSDDDRATYRPAESRWNGTTLIVSVAPANTLHVTEVALFAHTSTRGGVLVGGNFGHPPADQDRIAADFVWNGTSQAIEPVAPKETEPEAKESPAPLLPFLALALLSRR